MRVRTQRDFSPGPRHCVFLPPHPHHQERNDHARRQSNPHQPQRRRRAQPGHRHRHRFANAGDHPALAAQAPAVGRCGRRRLSRQPRHPGSKDERRGPGRGRHRGSWRAEAAHHLRRLRRGSARVSPQRDPDRAELAHPRHRPLQQPHRPAPRAGAPHRGSRARARGMGAHQSSGIRALPGSGAGTAHRHAGRHAHARRSR